MRSSRQKTPIDASCNVKTLSEVFDAEPLSIVQTQHRTTKVQPDAQNQQAMTLQQPPPSSLCDPLQRHWQTCHNPSTRHLKTGKQGSTTQTYCPRNTIARHLHHRALMWCWEVQSVQQIGENQVVTRHLTIPTADADPAWSRHGSRPNHRKAPDCRVPDVVWTRQRLLLSRSHSRL